ncbi:hypothetical protein HJ588_13780 [Flexivirga sp. ID2601S]|uniref:Uncharacterized protein n=1 Tax=Flexivirga aerilata TaxID=1656889 RepID=A0A849AIR9_9MICO|nr:hypothetical protein [Flexivirga aerilata]NNG40335.1 hypothetical protein [Flexivirga aerilata]
MTALDGDPVALRATADRCLVIAGECDAADTALLGALATAGAGWTGTAAVQFAGIGGDHRRLLQTARESLHTLAGEVRVFADLLDEAQRERDRLQARARDGREQLSALHARERLAVQAGEEETRAAVGRLIEDARSTLVGIDARIVELDHRMLLARHRFARQLDELLPAGMLGDIERLVSTGQLAIMLGGAVGKVFNAGKLLVGTARYGTGAFGRDLEALEKPLANLLRGPSGTARLWSDRLGVSRRLPGGITRALSADTVARSPALRRLLLEYEAAAPGIKDLVMGRGHDGPRDAADRAMGLIEVGGVLMLRGPGWSKVVGAVAIGSWAAWRIGGAMVDHKVTLKDIGDRARLDGSAVLGSEAGQQQLAKDLRRTEPVVHGIAQQADDLFAGMVTSITKVPRIPGIPNPLYDRLPKLSDHTDDVFDKITADSLGEAFGRQAPPVVIPPPIIAPLPPSRAELPWHQPLSALRAPLQQPRGPVFVRTGALS